MTVKGEKNVCQCQPEMQPKKLDMNYFGKWRRHVFHISLVLLKEAIERFSYECRKTKTNVITLTNTGLTDNPINQSEHEAIHVVRA